MTCLNDWSLDANVVRGIWFCSGLFCGWLQWRRAARPSTEKREATDE